PFARGSPRLPPVASGSTDQAPARAERRVLAYRQDHRVMAQVARRLSIEAKCQRPLAGPLRRKTQNPAFTRGKTRARPRPRWPRGPRISMAISTRGRALVYLDTGAVP